jgi:hypothetical protein
MNNKIHTLLQAICEPPPRHADLKSIIETAPPVDALPAPQAAWMLIGLIRYRERKRYYPTDGDDHPSSAGNRKATEEFVLLLNTYYNKWAATRPNKARASKPCSACGFPRWPGYDLTFHTGEYIVNPAYRDRQAHASNPPVNS